MTRITTYSAVQIHWVQFGPDENGAIDLQAAITLIAENSDRRTLEISGWQGVSMAQRTALRTALVAVLRAIVADTLNTDPATHDLVQTAGTWTEQPK